jgi:transposase
LRTGTPWRDLPERYGPYTTVYNRFNRWAKAAIWLRIFEALAARSPQSLQLIDSSISCVKASVCHWIETALFAPKQL